MKRQRTGRSFKTPRPIDKSIIVVEKAAVSSTDQNTTLITAAFPCTITGLRWSGTVSCNTSTISTHHWCIFLVRDGVTLDTINDADSDTLIEPEQNVLAFGSGRSVDTQIRHYEGVSKAMRKMMVGDSLVFNCVSQNTNTSDFTFGVQFFCKT